MPTSHYATTPRSAIATVTIATNGDVDWYSWERHDQDPVFCGLLDRGGAWRPTPRGVISHDEAPLPGTNMLVTRLRTETGVVELVELHAGDRTLDNGPHDYVELVAPGWLVRRARVIEGEATLDLRYQPQFDRVPADRRSCLSRTAASVVMACRRCSAAISWRSPVRMW